jgi:uncharacterized membrane protein YukC
MNTIDKYIGIGIIVASSLGAIVKWHYSKKKFKEEKEVLDAQENYWNNKDLEGEI